MEKMRLSPFVRVQRKRAQVGVPAKAFSPPYYKAPSLFYTPNRPRKATRLTQRSDGAIPLNVQKSAITGNSLRILGWNSDAVLGFWQGVDEYVTWKIRVDNGGDFLLAFCYSTPQDTRLEAKIGEQRLVFDLPATGGYGNQVPFTSGDTFTLKAGEYSVILKPAAQNWTACNVTRAVLLRQ
jgi:hypothetical protein